MKSILNRITYLFLASVALFACSEDTEFNTKVSAVKQLYTPVADKVIELEASTTATSLFEWEQAKAENGGLVLYEIAFDNADGDFNKPLYTLTSDNNGLFNQATVPHKTLNKIAEFAGIEPGQTGDIKWTVFSTKGLNEVKGEEERIVKITSLPGISNPPSELFITGEGAETGTDISTARQLKSLEKGVFEIYTRLEANKDFYFVDKKEDDAKSYGFNGKIVVPEARGQITETGVYKVYLDLTIGAYSITKVSKIELYFSPKNEYWAELAYENNGVFKAEDVNIEFKQEGWGRDERYKFKMTMMKGDEEVIQWLGSKNSDNSRPQADAPESYFFLYPVNNSQYDYSFKFADNIDYSRSDVIIYMQGEGDYRHEVVFKSSTN
ncbi:MAG: SusE domain-containing protein [Carboxylicivirga sp.]|jgi:hypothetical protein|nr:SusE domain-containing protein [Carboxylicivirga sp.]